MNIDSVNIRLFEIVKKYRNNSKVLHYLDENNLSEESLEEAIEEVCDNSPGGENYGFSFTYEQIKSKTKIKEFLMNKINQSEQTINNIRNHQNTLMTYLKDYE